MQMLRWMRVPGDTLFACGAVALVVFIASIRTKSSAVAVPKGRVLEVTGD